MAVGDKGERALTRCDVVHAYERDSGGAQWWDFAVPSPERVTVDVANAIFESKRKCPRWDSNPHFRLFESRLSNQLEYWGLRKGGYLLPCVVPPYRS